MNTHGPIQGPGRRALFERIRTRTLKARDTVIPPNRDISMRRARPMRRPGPSRTPTQAKALPTPPSAAVIALNRLGFGPRDDDIAEFNALGVTDAARLTAWVDQQLDPGSLNDAVCDTQLAAAGFSTLNKSLAQLWQDHVASDPPGSVRYQPYYEVERATILRAVWSRRQLLEVLTGFWNNHFNIYAPQYYIAPTWSHWDRAVIRANVFGNFRVMLGQVAQHPAMLYYLDNYTNSAAGPNENWARELFELHTLGADHYLGVMRQADVPTGPGGEPVGYVDDDVFEATRCFTGWTIDWDTGLFEYRADWHDHFQKWVLGTYIPANQPALDDGNAVLDAVATHPGTARFIATKLARRLIGDTPDPALIDDAASVFETASAAPDQLARVVRTIVLHPTFLTTWADKLKQPFEILVSAVRAADGRFDYAIGDGDMDSLLWRFDQTGHPLFQWTTPDGYPDHKDDWQSASPRVMTWRLVNWLINTEDDLGVHRLDVVGQTPAGIRTANELVDYWAGRVFGRSIPAAERLGLVDLMSQGHNPDFDLPLDSDDDTRERLQALVGVMFMAPSFLWR